MRSSTRPGSQRAPGSGPILVVDDDQHARTLLTSILADAGCAVLAVASAREARLALKANDMFGVLLSEVSMPGETGLDLLQSVAREHPTTATVLISARDDPAIADAAIEFGACGYLTKPVNRAAVLVAVRTALRRRAERERERAARSDLECTLDLRSLTLSQSAARLEDATEHGRVLQAETIHRWAQAAEFREPGINGHLERMSRYCGLLAKKLGLHAQSLELASVLHDIGKVAVPDRIVLKRGSLTADERLAVQTHAEIGYEMLSGSDSDILDLAAVIARAHHEKFDGSGYPHGLAGTEIPLEGRIAAVADVFDALTNDRVYRRAWSVQSALAWMTREREKHFDPDVLDALTCSIDDVLARPLVA
ncbi:MAG: HD domain-containing phosphohydrolase [Actinomycetes bacterium]